MCLQRVTKRVLQKDAKLDCVNQLIYYKVMIKQCYTDPPHYTLPFTGVHGVTTPFFPGIEHTANSVMLSDASSIRYESGFHCFKYEHSAHELVDQFYTGRSAFLRNYVVVVVKTRNLTTIGEEPLGTVIVARNMTLLREVPTPAMSTRR